MSNWKIFKFILVKQLILVTYKCPNLTDMILVNSFNCIETLLQKNPLSVLEFKKR